MELPFTPYQNKHSGDRCFILGSAPSLAQENLALLKDEIVFVCNRGYCATDVGLDHYDYYVLTEQVQYEGYQTDIQERVTAPRFYADHISDCEAYKQGIKEDHVKIIKHTTRKHHIRAYGIFPVNFTGGCGKTSSVVFDASLIAYFMGFKEIYLLGADFHYKKDSNYFFESDYKVVPLRQDMGLKYLEENVARFNHFFWLNNIRWMNLSKGLYNKSMMLNSTLEGIVNG